jgi:hypothetical protein
MVEPSGEKALSLAYPNVCQWQAAAGLIYGQVKKSYRRRKLVRITPVMRLGTEAALKSARPRIGFLRTVEHGVH